MSKGEDIETKTTEEISVEDYTKVANKKWVSYDDHIKAIAEAKKEERDKREHIYQINLECARKGAKEKVKEGFIKYLTDRKKVLEERNSGEDKRDIERRGAIKFIGCLIEELKQKQEDKQ